MFETEERDMRHALITRDGLARLTEELDRLTTSGRQTIAERIRTAVSTDANVAENADYHHAREEQALLERRIAVLRAQIAAAEPVDPDAANGTVDIGERVRLRELRTGRTLEYTVVGSLEADPLARRISAASPLGKALLGRPRGAVVTAKTPKGRRRFEILAIEVPVGADEAVR
jgi:transcription elongation factor GreA